MSEASPAKRPGWLLFVLAAVSGLTLAFACYVGLALGECLPRDGGAGMHACDAAKAFEFRGYPALVLAALAGALAIGLRRRTLGAVLAVAAPFVAFAVLLVIEKVFFGQ